MERLFHNQFQRSIPHVSIVDLAAMKQQINNRLVHIPIQKAINQYLLSQPEKAFAKVAFGGLKFCLKRKNGRTTIQRPLLTRNKGN